MFNWVGSFRSKYISDFGIFFHFITFLERSLPATGQIRKHNIYMEFSKQVNDVNLSAI